jgi:hypothetical protein
VYSIRQRTIVFLKCIQTSFSGVVVGVVGFGGGSAVGAGGCLMGG